MQQENIEQNWLKIGTSWDASLMQKTAEVIEIKDKRVKRKVKDKKDKKKKQKDKDKDKKQVAIHMTQQELDLYYDKVIEDKKRIDPKAGFIYRHELAPHLLTIQVIRFGFAEIFQYGHREKEVPQYRRIDHNILLGLPSDAATQTFLEELAIPIVQRYSFSKPPVKAARYTEIEYDHINFQIRPLERLNSTDEFVQFNNRLLVQGQGEEYTLMQEKRVVREAKELQQRITENADDLVAWKRFLLLQEKIAEVQGYAEDVIVASRRLAILEKLEQASEILADHPWVLSYKILIMQNLQHKDEDFERQIGSLWDMLFQKYIHVQPIWILYLDHKLKSEKFNGTALRIAAVQSVQNLKQLIDESKRPQTITYYKKIYLELIQQISFYENEMGFRERAFGIYQSLMELNIFAPQCHQRTADYETKLIEFQNYWEEYAFYRTGELCQYTGWKDHYEDILEVNDHEFIGHYCTNYIESKVKVECQVNPLKEYLRVQKQARHRWRPSNTKLEQDYLQINVDSLVLYEDIETYLNIYNDSETKVLIVSGMLEQLGFPALQGPLLPNLNNYYMAQVCHNLTEQFIKSQLKSKESRGAQDFSNIFVSDLLLRFQALLSYFSHKISSSTIEKFIYVRRLLSHLKAFQQSEALLSYCMVLEGILYLNREKLEQCYPESSFQRSEISQALERMKALLKQYGDEYPVLWLFYVEFEFLSNIEGNKQHIERIYNQIYSFQKTPKRRLQVLYFLNQFYFNLGDYESVKQVMQRIAALVMCDEQPMSMTVIIIKIRGEYMKQKNQNKLNNPIKIEAQKQKTSRVFNLSKKAMLQSFILMLDFTQLGQLVSYPGLQDIENHLQEIEMEYHHVKGMFFQDQLTKAAILNKYQNEMLLNFLNFFRQVWRCQLPLKEQVLIRISSCAMQHEPNSLIFYSQLLNLLQSKGVYFLKFESVKLQMQNIMADENFFQSPQVAWMILILLRQSDQHESDLTFKSKLGYLHDFLLKQSRKSITQIYCESHDQETFEAVVNIMYNYYLEKILLTISRYLVNQDQLVRLIYKAVKAYPFSIDLYNILLRESNEDQKESLLNVIEEKELKTFQIQI